MLDGHAIVLKVRDMRTSLQGQKRPADMIATAIMVAKILAQIMDEFQAKAAG